MSTFKDQAICIRLLDWSETSQIVGLLTHNHGKVSAVARGSKRWIPSALAKFAGGMDLLGCGEAVLMESHGSDLAKLIEWNPQLRPDHLCRDLETYHRAHYAADLVHHLMRDLDPHPGTYVALEKFLGDLALPGRGAIALLEFQWRLAQDLGYQPILEHDAQTHLPLPEGRRTLAFSAQAGGLVADTGGSDRWRVRQATAGVLRQAAAGALSPDGPPQALKGANRLLCAYFRAILDEELPTMTPILATGDAFGEPTKRKLGH